MGRAGMGRPRFVGKAGAGWVSGGPVEKSIERALLTILENYIYEQSSAYYSCPGTE